VKQAPGATARLSAAALVMLAAVLGLHSAFALGAFDGMLKDALVQKYLVAGKRLQWRLEGALRIERGVSVGGLRKLLNNAREQVFQPEDAAAATPAVAPASGVLLALALVNGQIVSATPGELDLDGGFPAGVLPEHSEEPGAALGTPRYLKKNQHYYIVYPLHTAEQRVFMLLVVRLDQWFLSLSSRTRVQAAALHVAEVLALALGALLLWCLFAGNTLRTLAGSKRGLPLALISSALAIQLATGALLFSDLLRATSHIARQKIDLGVELLAAQAADERDATVRAGRAAAAAQRLRLGELIEVIPELGALIVTDRRGRVLHVTASAVPAAAELATPATGYIRTAVKEDTYESTTSIPNGGGADFLRLIAKASLPSLLSLVVAVLADMVTGTLISVLLFGELLIVILRLRDRQAPAERFQREHFIDVRPALFFFVLAIDLSMSFIPLHMEALYRGGPFSRELMLSLPISVEFLFVGIFLLVAGAWLDRRGWAEPFLAGIVLTLVGAAHSWLAPDGVQFIVSRGVIGAGYGLTLMAAQGFVINRTTAQTKARGLASLFAGLYAGSICGSAGGAMLAERFGYPSVFLTSALMLVAVALYGTRLVLTHARADAGPLAGDIAAPGAGGLLPVWRFLSDRNVLGLIFLSSLPASIAVIGFLNYFGPLYLSRLGVSQSTIGQVLIIHGVCLVFLGPLISRYVDLSGSKRLWIFVGSLLGSCAFLLFTLADGLLAAALAVFFLGLSGSFVLATQSAMALQLKVTMSLGKGKALGIFRSTSRIGQVLGPLVFAWLIAASNIEQAAVYLGLAYLALALCFLVLTTGPEREPLGVARA